MERYVYVLQLANGQYYVGSTNDMIRRFGDHTTGHTKTTKRIPVEKILFHKLYGTKKEARSIELFLKKQKSRVVIEKFMTDTWQNL